MNYLQTRCTRSIQFVDLRFIFYLYLFLVLVVSLQSYLMPSSALIDGGKLYRAYNNFLIFKTSFFNLIHHQDLYALHPNEHYDLYKYSPSFALVFGVVAWLPDFLGLLVWNAINALLFFWGVKQLPNISDKQKCWILLFCSVELVGTLQHSQTNAMIAGLLLFAFGYLEQNKLAMASWGVWSAGFIKLFGLALFPIGLFYRPTIKSVLTSFLGLIGLLLLPLIALGGDYKQLVFLYTSWYHLLATDYSASLGISVMGIFKSWFGIEISKAVFVGCSFALLLLPFLRFSQYKQALFRVHGWCLLVIWMVIFNHKAESNTFFIAMAGVSVWYFGYAQKTSLNTILCVLCFILTSLSVTDLMPRFIREQVVYSYCLKALLPSLIWCKILFDLCTLRFEALLKKTF